MTSYFDHVPYQQSLDMRDLGFDEPCSHYYIVDFQNFKHDGELHKNSLPDGLDRENIFQFYTLKNRPHLSSAPTFHQSIKWFREKYGIPSHLELLDGGWDYVIYTDIEEELNYGDGPFQTYEEAELALLIKLIEIVKETK